ncbi:MAG TPA: TrbI/VirB10 family protein [Edaphobacter sp.]
MPLLFSPSLAQSQTSQATLPSGIPLSVMIEKHLPMRAGQPIRAQLIYPVYVDDTLVLPEKTIVTGTITELRSNHSHRVNARLNGDFTPFHTPVVRFNQIILADGTSVPIVTDVAADGAPIIRLVAPPPHKGGFVHKEWDTGMHIVHDQIAVFTAPEKGDRLLQLFYHQLPYHPERIPDGTAWTVETSEPVTIPPHASSTIADSKPAPPADPPVTSDESGRPTWIIQAYLHDTLTSATAKTGQPIEAIVTEPVYNPDHTIAVPEGAKILGAITQAKHARSFGRAGALGFDFKQIVLPDGHTQNVQAALTGADSASAAGLAMDSEGKVKPKPEDKVVVPLILAFLATRPLDEEHGEVSNMAGKDFVGSNGFGLVGNIIGLAGGSPHVAAGIGAYGTAVSLYRRLIARGHEVTFVRDTHIVLQTTPRNAAVLKADPH